MSTSPLPSAVLRRLPFGETASLAYRVDGPSDGGPRIGAGKTGLSSGLARLPVAIACWKGRAGGTGVVISDSQSLGGGLPRPPEQLSRERADGRADAYTIGAVHGWVPGACVSFLGQP